MRDSTQGRSDAQHNLFTTHWLILHHWPAITPSSQLHPDLLWCGIFLWPVRVLAVFPWGFCAHPHKHETLNSPWLRANTVQHQNISVFSTLFLYWFQNSALHQLPQRKLTLSYQNQDTTTETGCSSLEKYLVMVLTEIFMKKQIRHQEHWGKSFWEQNTN